MITSKANWYTFGTSSSKRTNEKLESISYYLLSKTTTKNPALSLRLHHYFDLKARI